MGSRGPGPRGAHAQVRGQKAEQGSVGAQSPAEREPPTPRPPSFFPLLPLLFPPSAAPETSPGRAPLPGPAPLTPRPAHASPRLRPSPRPDFDPDGGSASGRRLGKLAAPGLLYPHPPTRSEGTPPCTCQPFRENGVLAGPLGMDDGVTLVTHLESSWVMWATESWQQTLLIYVAMA